MNDHAGSIEVVATLDSAPGNVTLGRDGQIYLSLHQFHNPEMRVAELIEGQLVPFPTGPEAGLLAFEAVLGIQRDTEDRIWMLDNGSQNARLPKLVAWDTRNDRLDRVIYLPPPISTAQSFTTLLLSTSSGMLSTSPTQSRKPPPSFGSIWLPALP
ncbi:MAG: hypothetical protein P8Y20_11680, partial [Gammaproteobacteria bacterium]